MVVAFSCAARIMARAPGRPRQRRDGGRVASSPAVARSSICSRRSATSTEESMGPGRLQASFRRKASRAVRRARRSTPSCSATSAAQRNRRRRPWASGRRRATCRLCAHAHDPDAIVAPVVHLERHALGRGRELTGWRLARRRFAGCASLLRRLEWASSWRVHEDWTVEADSPDEVLSALPSWLWPFVYPDGGASCSWVRETRLLALPLGGLNRRTAPACTGTCRPHRRKYSTGRHRSAERTYSVLPARHRG
jgi:hypothetical protein